MNITISLEAKVLDALSKAAVRENVSLEEMVLRGIANYADRWESMLSGCSLPEVARPAVTVTDRRRTTLDVTGIDGTVGKVTLESVRPVDAASGEDVPA